MNSAKEVEGFRSSLAILIGIDRYTDGVPELRTPVADVTKLAEILETLHGFRSEVVFDENATLNNLRIFLDDLRTRVGKDDRVLFYFAGHGIALESNEGPQGYLLPQDAARDTTDRYMPMVELNDALAALPCRHMLVILDCCFAGAMRWSSTRDLALAPESLHQERYTWYVQDPAWQAIASAAHDQKALDVAVGEALGDRGQTAGHSPFAMALMDGLSGAADHLRADGTGDGVITATELFLHLEERLMPPPGGGGQRQTPTLWPLAKHDKGQFVFLVPGKDLDLPPAPTLDQEANPWRGLRPYESTHADLFFGRRRASEDLLAKVLRGPLVVVTGPSGVGKSSLVLAGLLPRLPASVQPIVVRPGQAPFASLAAAMQVISADAPDTECLRSDSNALAAWVTAQSSASSQELMLVIDQSEELITMNGDEKVSAQFLALISDALRSVKSFRVVVTIRSDFEPQLAQSSLKDLWPSSRYLVPQMTQDELRRVIEGPATVKVMRFASADLVDTLVNDVIQMPGALPLLSFGLSEMYLNYLRRRADDRTLTSEDYHALEGGVTGSLRIRANRLIDNLDDEHQLAARRILERLVSVESGEFARRRVQRSELETVELAENRRVEQVVSQLVDARLVVTDEIDGQPYLELAHDALIFGWDRLRAWVREDIQRIVSLRRMTPDAQEWIKSADPNLLWDDAARIAVLSDLSSALTPGLNFSEKRFADASRRRRSRNISIGRAVAVSLVALAIGASLASFLFYRQLIESDRRAAILTSAAAIELTDEGSSEEALMLGLQNSMLFSDADAPDELLIALDKATTNIQNMQTYNVASTVDVFDTQIGLVVQNNDDGSLMLFDRAAKSTILLPGGLKLSAVSSAMSTSKGKIVLLRVDGTVESIMPESGKRSIVGKMIKSKKIGSLVFSASDEVSAEIIPGGIVIQSLFLESKDYNERVLYDIIDGDSGTRYLGEIPQESQRWYWGKDKSNNNYIYNLKNKNVYRLHFSSTDITVKKSVASEGSWLDLIFGQCRDKLRQDNVDFIKAIEELEYNEMKYNACTNWDVGAIMTGSMNTSAGPRRSDKIFGYKEKTEDLRDILSSHIDGKIPGLDMSWVGSDGSNLIAAINARTLYVMDASSSVRRYSFSTPPSVAMFAENGKMLVALPSSGRIVLQKISENTEVHENSSENPDFLKAQDASTTDEKIRRKNLTTCGDLGADKFYAEAFHPRIIQLSLTDVGTNEEQKIVSRIKDVENNTHIDLEATCISLSRNLAWALVIRDAHIELHDLNIVFSQKSFSSRSLKRTYNISASSAYFIGSTNDFIASVSNTIIRVSDVTLEQKASSEVYRGDYFIMSAEPDDTGKRLVIVSAIGEGDVTGKVYSVSARRDWIDLGRNYKWLRATVDSADSIIVQESSIIRTFPIRSLSEMRNKAETVVSEYCKPLKNGDWRTSKCWPPQCQ